MILCCEARDNDYATKVHDGGVVVIDVGVTKGNNLVAAASIFNRELEISTNLVVADKPVVDVLFTFRTCNYKLKHFVEKGLSNCDVR